MDGFYGYEDFNPPIFDSGSTPNPRDDKAPANGFDRQQFLKRTRAFHNTIFPSARDRFLVAIKNIDHTAAVSILNKVLSDFRTFVRKVRRAQDARAYYLCEFYLYQFLLSIDYPFSELDQWFTDQFPKLREQSGSESIPTPRDDKAPANNF